MIANALKDVLDDLSSDRHVGYVQRLWSDWCRRATRGRIKPPSAFVRKLCGYPLGRLLANSRYQLRISVTAGIDSEI